MSDHTVTLWDAGRRLEYTTELVVEVCCCCAIPFAMPRSLQREARKDPDVWFYCCAGHRQHYDESEADRLRKKLAAAERRAASAEETARIQRKRASDAEGTSRALRGVVTRERRRVGRGVCPCCGRSFENLRRHMAGQHPDYAESQPDE
jgi:hypothetical protein